MKMHDLQSSFTNRLRNKVPEKVTYNLNDLVEFTPCNVSAHSLIARPNRPGVVLSNWLAQNKDLVNNKLLECGAILFRDFSVSDQQAFLTCVQGIGQPLLNYKDRSTPRTDLGKKIYTSTEYPPDQSIPLHNENSYTSSWPDNLWFWCDVAPRSGGETTLASSSRIYQSIDPDVREEFERKKICYVNNYRSGLGLSWQTAFQTDNRAEVESYCDANNIAYKWTGDDALRTSRTGQASLLHPVTGEKVWFNQAHLFNTNSLAEEVKHSLHVLYKESELPRQSYFGDGTAIDDQVLQHISSVYRAHTTVYPWQQHDLLLIDNLLKAHGRNPFNSDRRVLVAMTKEQN
tara:strand:+ start:160 stop:1194 length:1035 start_codon:yes stop_codon:yes gene_type:complete